jgi:hypothetical protein
MDCASSIITTYTYILQISSKSKPYYFKGADPSQVITVMWPNAVYGVEQCSSMLSDPLQKLIIDRHRKRIPYG